MSQRLLVLTVIAVTSVLGACRHAAPASASARTLPVSTAPTAPRAPAPPPTPAARPAAPLTEEELFRRMSLDELNAEHPLSDVYFDYNQNVIRDEAQATLQRDAAWLAKWPQTRILVEGHCDERGSAEYNLALGNERATTVRSYLASLGVQPDRIVVRSLGKEAPFCRDTGESCWAQNRRGHFLITAK
jgi:peptidoglycan-associated lipoprotein